MSRGKRTDVARCSCLLCKKETSNVGLITHILRTHDKDARFASSGHTNGNPGNIPWNKGLSKIDLPQLGNSGTKKGVTPWNKNKKMPMLSGKNHYSWISDRTKIKKQEERNNPNDKHWKYSVYKRDNFRCRLLDNSCCGRLEAHHIKGWTNYPELRYKTNNGITLCHAHHPRKRAEEKRLESLFNELVSVSK